MAFIKQGSPSTILKVTELIKEGEAKKIKVIADRPEKPSRDGEDEKIGGTA